MAERNLFDLLFLLLMLLVDGDFSPIAEFQKN